MFHDLFPTPVLTANIGRELTKEELDVAHFHARHENRVDTATNSLSIDRNIIENHHNELSSIKDFINANVRTYIDEVLSPPPGLEFYYTNSWFTFNEPGQEHKPHVHQNCILSGTFYFNADRDHDCIDFINFSKYKQIWWEEVNVNRRNEEATSFHVGSGDLVIFPPGLYHAVPKTTSKNTRICLAFNVFFRGIIGTDWNINLLHIR